MKDFKLGFIVEHNAEKIIVETRLPGMNPVTVGWVSLKRSEM